MISTEVLFLVGFVIFIAAILVLDMLVIDRKAHVVSIKEAGTWMGVWIGLALIFVFDSIPAVFSVTLDPYVVFFSNIFAILGLRALFFLLAAVADKFRYLKVGVSVLLVFIGAKMLIHKYVEIGAVIGISLVKKLPEKGFRYFTTAVTCISVIMLLV